MAMHGGSCLTRPLYIPSQRMSIQSDAFNALYVHPLDPMDEGGPWGLAALFAGRSEGVRLGDYPDREAADEAFEAMYDALGWPDGVNIDTIIDNFRARQEIDQ